MIVRNLPDRSPIRVTGNKPVGIMVLNDAFALDNINGDNVSQDNIDPIEMCPCCVVPAKIQTFWSRSVARRSDPDLL